MSGRKDYSYTLEAARIAAQQAAIAARRVQRAEQTRQRLQIAKVDAQRRAAELAMQQREFNQKQRQAAADQARRDVETQLRQAKKELENSSYQQEVRLKGQTDSGEFRRAELQQNDHSQRDHEARANAASKGELQQQIESQLQTLLQWRASFSENDDMQNFTARELRDWSKSTEETIAMIASATSSIETLSRLQDATYQAEQLEQKAGEVSDKFFARNAVMTDVIDSLKEIGFFVQDPEFADPENPAGAVIIRANRGNQSLCTSISLDQKVESDWQGVHGEYCTDGFFEFVQAMDDRGVIITPNDFNLKPRLLKKGAKDLPDGRQKSAGGSE
jgi:hypothetical protein